ncbi:preprotein translocase subunit SecY [Candidatus Woesearchaeota archaeon]|nr:preprotein translocase subunit SecY [Candidatus Woesearchaeota archaeon]
MVSFEALTQYLPEVAGPKGRRLSFKEKATWTLFTLVLFYLLGRIPLFGLGENALQQFEYLSVILGAEFGSIISLGIGPLVTASIVLQLLSGSGIIKFDLTSHEGKKKFQAVQKVTAFFFILFEASVYVLMGGLAPAATFLGTSIFAQLQFILIIQLFVGGILIMFMDEVVSKWGFGSGISLFIAAGVSQSLFIRAFSWTTSPTNPDIVTGAVWAFFQSLGSENIIDAALLLSSIVATVVVFMLAVYAQGMKVEIPLSFGRVRGHGIRWPLSFVYTSNIPVILVSALIANIQLWAQLMQKWGYPVLGTFNGGSPATGFVSWIYAPNIMQKIITWSMTPGDVLQALFYVGFMIIGCVVFSYFWVQTAGMDARSQARQMLASGLQIPGFRKDERILEHLLERYISPLTIMGAITVGFLAAFADLAGSLVHGTSLLLTVMIIYKLYEEIAKQHMLDMHPMMRRFME